MYFLRHAIGIFFVMLVISPVFSQENDQSYSDSLERAAKKVNSKQQFKLAYGMKKGQLLRWSVEHVASTKTQIAGELEKTSSRSRSTKSWKVTNVDSVGNMTFVHTIDSVSMWQQIGDSEPVAYDSTKDKEVPVEYEGVDEKIGKPLAVITVSPNGKVLDRKTSLQQAKFGVGEITVPLPNKSINIGYKWYVPIDLSAKNEDGIPQQLKARLHYELSDVKKDKAFITYRTEVLTPVSSEKVRSQIMQQLTRGYIVFDMAMGVPVRKEVEWDEKVQGYEGADSYLSYVGKMSEKFINSQAPSKLSPLTAKKPADGTNVPAANSKTATPKVSNMDLKPREGKPRIRK